MLINCVRFFFKWRKTFALARRQFKTSNPGSSWLTRSGGARIFFLGTYSTRGTNRCVQPRAAKTMRNRGPARVVILPRVLFTSKSGIERCSPVAAKRRRHKSFAQNQKIDIRIFSVSACSFNEVWYICSELCDTCCVLQGCSRHDPSLDK